MRILHDLREFMRGHPNPRDVINLTSSEVRKSVHQHLPSSLLSLRLEAMTDAEVVREATQARDWLFTVLNWHDKALDREHTKRMLRSVVQKDLADRGASLSDMESLYMKLTDYDLTSSENRLRSAFTLVLQLNLAERLKDVSELAAVRTEGSQRAAEMDADAEVVREKIVEKVRESQVDHFACAIPLSQLATNNAASIVDDNVSCCPICQNSYTALAEFTIEELLADYPVRIKHCGHVVGKACLEQWMMTPKIEEAKYPHRTCPLCRVKIEGVKRPKTPRGVFDHLQSDRRAQETVKEFLYDWDIEMTECFDAVSICMSEEIAIQELIGEVEKNRVESGDDKMFRKEETVLTEKMTEIKKEKRVWGFKGDGIWRKLREEWMNTGMPKKE